MSKSKLKLLIVEDEPDICLTVQSFFGRRGFLVSTTGSGLEALSMIKASQPDIVLLDIALNDLNGIEVLKQLRETDLHTKVVVITGQLYPNEEIERVQKLGISGYRNKPLVLEEVEKLVFQVLGKKMTARPIKFKRSAPISGNSADKDIVHKLSNLLGIIRNKCENFTLNVEEGVYKDKSSDELVHMSVDIMKEVEETVDRAVTVVAQIKGDSKKK